MVSMNNMDLRFIEFSVENYLNVFIELLGMGKKKFLIKGINQETTIFLRKAKEYRNSYSFSFYASHNNSEIPCDDITYKFNIEDIDVIFIFITNASNLSKALFNYIKIKNCIICAPITEHYYQKVPVLIQSIPKSGTHVLFECMKAFGYKEPPTLELPEYHADILPNHFYNLQHMATDYLALPYSKICKFIHMFSNSIIVFIYRDPRDIVVSLSYYLASQKQYHMLYLYMKSLSQKNRITTVIKGDYPIPIYLNNHLTFSGNIRELMLLYSNWLKYPLPNLIPIRFEDLIGPKGGGDINSQLQALWKLQLGLHVPGTPRSYSEKVFSESSLTFRKGQIKSYIKEFSKEHHMLFNELPQDFMKIYGYGRQSICEEPQQCFTGSISLNDISIPFSLGENYKDYNLVSYKGSIYAILQGSGDLDLVQISKNKLKEYQDKKQLFIANTIYAVKKAVDQKGIFMPVIQECFKNFILVRYKDRIYAILKGLDIDLLEAGKSKIKKYQNKKQLFIAHSIDAVKKAVDQENIEMPVLQESYQNFNLVLYKDRIYAILQGIELDLTEAGKSEIKKYQDEKRMFIGSSIDEAKDFINRLLSLPKAGVQDE